MDYQQSRAYVKDADRYAGGALDLTNIKELMKRLGNPQDQLKYVHVAGTNGKGSVIAYLYTTLSEAGYRVGRYISPSVYSYREKMEVAGSAVSREQFAGYVTRVAAAIKEGIDFMITKKGYDGKKYYGNWWDWQIGSAQPLTDTLILLHDDLIEKDDATRDGPNR